MLGQTLAPQGAEESSGVNPSTQEKTHNSKLHFYQPTG